MLRAGSAQPASPTMRAGTPATVLLAGTADSTTEPAATRDMDVTVEMASVSAFAVTFDGITNFLAHKNMPLKWDEEGIEIAGVPVQFIPVGGDLDKEALATAEIVTESDVSFKV